MIDGPQRQSFIDIVQRLAAACVAESSVPHLVHQSILNNAEITEVLYDVIASDEQHADVLAATFRCLQALARGFSIIQEEMFDNLDTFLGCEGLEHGWENDMAAAVAEIFTDNRKTALRVKAPQIEAMADLLAASNIHLPGMLDVFQALTRDKRTNTPFQRNQLLIVKAMMARRERIVNVAFVDEGTDAGLNRQRLDLLRTQPQDDASHALLDYHLRLVMLLATCAEGRAEYIQSMCQTIFTEDELLDVLGAGPVGTARKACYLKYLVFTYLDTDNFEATGMIEPERIDRLFRGLRELGDAEINQYGAKGAPSPSQIDFAIEAFVPAVTHSLQRVLPIATERVAVPVVQQFGGVIGRLSMRLLAHLTTRAQLKTLALCLTTLEAVNPRLVNPDVLVQVRQTINRTSAHPIESEDAQLYNQRFAKQNNLNSQLVNFCQNVKLAYEGTNTIGVQLPDVRHGHHHADKRYCEPATEDEYLPLGPELQSLVSLFVAPQDDGTMAVTPHLTTLVRQWDASRKIAGTLRTKARDAMRRVDVKTLQVTRAIIHNEMKRQRDHKPLQDQIVGAGAVLAVAYMLSSPRDDVVREALSLLVAILDGGNRLGQQSFESHFLSTREETFFDDVIRRLRRSVNSVQEMRTLRKQAEAEQRLDASVHGPAPTEERITTMTVANPAFDKDGEGDDAGKAARGAAAAAAAAANRELTIRDEGNIQLVLRVLQLMCEVRWRMRKCIHVCVPAFKCPCVYVCVSGMNIDGNCGRHPRAGRDSMWNTGDMKGRP